MMLVWHYTLWPPLVVGLEPDCSGMTSPIFFLSSSSAARRSCNVSEQLASRATSHPHAA